MSDRRGPRRRRPPSRPSLPPPLPHPTLLGGGSIGAARGGVSGGAVAAAAVAGRARDRAGPGRLHRRHRRGVLGGGRRRLPRPAARGAAGRLPGGRGPLPEPGRVPRPEPQHRRGDRRVLGVDAVAARSAVGLAVLGPAGPAVAVSGLVPARRGGRRLRHRRRHRGRRAAAAGLAAPARPCRGPARGRAGDPVAVRGRGVPVPRLPAADHGQLLPDPVGRGDLVVAAVRRPARQPEPAACS